jgi:hypothetical protein
VGAVAAGAGTGSTLGVVTGVSISAIGAATGNESESFPRVAICQGLD